MKTKEEIKNWIEQQRLSIRREKYENNKFCYGHEDGIDMDQYYITLHEG